jgi:hypothetical protein
MHYFRMKEIIIYTISGISSLFILGYVVHMFLGGLVSEKTETIAIAAAVCVGALAMGYMVWDVVRRRRGY